MSKFNFRDLFGLAGVDKNENHQAIVCGRRFELAMVLVAIWLPLQWYLQRTHQISNEVAVICSWLIWFFFMAETIVMFCLTTHKINYLVKNWMNIVIIIVGLPPIWMETPIIAVIRVLQLLLILRLLLPIWNSTIAILSRNRLGATLIVACIVTVFWGILMSIIDPNIKTPWDGIWLAWATVTTIGYGDIVPISVVGRLLDILLMVMGVGLTALLTANFSAYFIGKSTDALKREDSKAIARIKDIQQQLTEIQQQLAELQDKKD